MIVWIRTWQLGIKSLLLYPMRSMLTVLGIFIGVASVIWLMAIGEGISLKAQEQIESLGATNIIVRTVRPANPEMVTTAGRRQIPSYGLKREDYRKIRDTIPSVTASMPVREIRRTFARGSREVDGRLVGTTPLYTTMSQIEMDSGRFITEIDSYDALPYCVLSANVAERLFPAEDPIGKTIRIQSNQNDPGFPYEVIGVAKPRGATASIGGSFAGQDFSNDVYIPITTLWSRMRDTVITRRGGNFEGEVVELSQMTLQVDDVKDVKETADIIQATLLEGNRKDREDFRVVVPLELLEQARTTRIMFNVFMGLIAAISLLVGGIGIMNIMLATVTERTREIGIRRALGAKRGDIIRQFLVETVALSMVGGAVGVLVGLSCRPVTIFVMDIIKTRMPDVISALPEIVQDIQPVIVWLSIPLAFSVAVIIGVVFGLYPAYRAAMMDPIEALRHE